MQTIHNWDPLAPEVLQDPIAAYDGIRQKHAVAYSEYLQYSVFRHADILNILLDHETFSSESKRYVSVPNTMDPPQHTAYRAMIEPYFGMEKMAQFRPVCKNICDQLINNLDMGKDIEIMFGLAHPFALQLQSAFLGWPTKVHQALLEWINKKNAATISGDQSQVVAVASEFDSTIRSLLSEREQNSNQPLAESDITTQLMHEQVNGKNLTKAEIVSLLRNWTVGELGTMASSVGIIANYLAHHPEVQQLLRKQPELIIAANDEILRIHAPLIANKRTTTKDVNIGGVDIPAGSRITIIWASGNRDETVFGDPDEFRLDRNPRLNLLYGAGVHECPGAPLARMELELITKALLAYTSDIRPSDKKPILSVYPASGFREIYLNLVQ